MIKLFQKGRNDTALLLFQGHTQILSRRSITKLFKVKKNNKSTKNDSNEILLLSMRKLSLAFIDGFKMLIMMNSWKRVGDGAMQGGGGGGGGIRKS